MDVPKPALKNITVKTAIFMVPFTLRTKTAKNSSNKWTDSFLNGFLNEEFPESLDSVETRSESILKKKIKPIADTIRISEERPILELDEQWSYVEEKSNPVWTWLALERQTCKIVGVAFGDRTDEKCREMWMSLPPDYRKRAKMYSDKWHSYANVLPSKRLFQVDKKSGETSHIERFNNTLRQRCPALVRKALSFSKGRELHEIRIRIFIDHYNEHLAEKIAISHK